jgi:hypothetical protein
MNSMGLQHIGPEEVARVYLAEGSLVRAGRHFGVSGSAVQKKLRFAGIARRPSGPPTGNQNGRKRAVWADYFRSIDSDSKAYFLGLLAADGCVTGTEVALGFVERDRVILDGFREAIQSTHPLILVAREGRERFLKIQFSCVEMTKDLAALGVRARKTVDFVFPPIESFRSSFVRGYFDGDGCAYIVSGRPRSFFCGTPQFLLELLRVLRLEVGVVGGYILPHSSVTSRLFLAYRDTVKLSNWMYAGATVWLPRKRDRLCA